MLALSRSTVRYCPQSASERDPALLRRIDELHLEHPFAGSRLPRDLLDREGFEVAASTWQRCCAAWASRRSTGSRARADAISSIRSMSARCEA